MEKNIKQNETGFRTLYEKSLDAILVVLLSSQEIVTSNSRTKDLLGYEKEDIVGKKFPSLYAHKERQAKDLLSSIKVQDAVFISEDFLNKDGDVCVMDLTIGMVPWNGEDAALLTLRDAGERQKAEEEMQSLYNEREILLREIHHRVKNNFQIIASLLDYNVMQTDDTKYKNILIDTYNRIITMSRIHEQLYQTENLSHINMRKYLENLVLNIRDSYGACDVDITIDIPDIHLPIDQAISCGLLSNEIISNSFKYAFPDSSDGQIKVSMTKHDHEISLEISDNGLGLPEEISYEKSDSLGLRIIDLLTQQLEGTKKIESNNGTYYSLYFPIQK